MHYGWILYSCALIALGVKIVINWYSYGTVDITSWIEYGRYITANDSFSVYEHVRLYNHPPLMSLWLKFLMWLTDGAAPYFPRVFRMAPIAADFGSTVVLWSICRAYFRQSDALILAAMATLSPILIMVSGFHGNTDPIFGFLILAAGYLLAVRRQLVPAALVFALSIQIKVVPLLLAPAFFFWIRNSRERLRFVLWFGGATLLGFLAHLLTVPQFLIRNIFLYVGPGGIWGFGNLLNNSQIYRGAGIALVVASTLYFSWRMGQESPAGAKLEDIPAEKGLNLFKALALSYVSFLALTPGFGVQYLSWLASLVIFLSVPLALMYSMSASAFLLMVYALWCCGLRWGTDSWSGVWPPPIELMGYATWLSTVLLFAHHLRFHGEPRVLRTHLRNPLADGSRLT